jgi:hypothetical protein
LSEAAANGAGSEFLDVGDPELTNCMVSPEADDNRPGLNVLHPSPGLIQRLLVAGLAGVSRESGEEIEQAPLLPLRQA